MQSLGPQPKRTNIPEVKNMPYEQRLQGLKLPSLEFRRFRGNLIETFKIANNYYDKQSTSSLFKFKTNNRLRGHTHTIIKRTVNKDQYKHFFSNRVVISGINYQKRWSLLKH